MGSSTNISSVLATSCLEKETEEKTFHHNRSASSGDTTHERDQNVVDFEENDSEDPQNWSSSYKWSITMLLTLMSFTVNLAIVMCAPAVPAILKEFHSDSSTYRTLLVSIWELGEVIGPLILAPLSELYGRSPVYNISSLFFIVFSIACASSTSVQMLLAFRFLIGMTPPTATLNAPIVADMFPKEERGRAISTVQLPALVGTVIGPTVGSYLTAAAGWRWTFWLAAIICGVFEIMFVLVYRETYRVRILHKRVMRLRKDTGNTLLRSKYDTGKSKPRVFSDAIVRPLRMLVFSPIVQLMGLYVAIVYGYLFLILTTIGDVFQGAYDFPEKSIGLVYVGIGIGMIIAILCCRSTLDRFLKFFRARTGTCEPEHRLPPMILGGVVLPAGLFCYGWAAARHAHPVVPVIGTAICGFGLTTTTIPASTYIVDAFGVHAASATASMSALRYLAGAVVPLIGPPLYARLGVGWGNSVLGFIALSLLPVPILLMRFGVTLRKQSRIKTMQ